VDEVVNIQEIVYDRKRKDVMRSTTKKRRLTLDNKLLITTKETLLNRENAKTTNMIRARMAITDATLNIEKRDEKELAASNKGLDHLCHLVKYYQYLMQEIVFPRSEFRETYGQFTSERNLFTICIVNFQEDTIMGLTTCKYVHRWHEKAHHALEWTEYINAVLFKLEYNSIGVKKMSIVFPPTHLFGTYPTGFLSSPRF